MLGYLNVSFAEKRIPQELSQENLGPEGNLSNVRSNSPFQNRTISIKIGWFAVDVPEHGKFYQNLESTLFSFVAISPLGQFHEFLDLTCLVQDEKGAKSETVGIKRAARGYHLIGPIQ